MSLIPFPYNFIAGGVAIVVLVGGVALAKHSYDERRRDEGRHEVRAEWDAAIEAQQKREAKAAQDAIDNAVQAKAKSDEDFKALARRNAILQGKLASLAVDGAIAGSVRDAIRTSNGTSAGSTEADSSPTTGLALSDWAAETARLYRACRDQVIGWVKWDDERVMQ